MSAHLTVVDKLVEECSENIDGNKMLHNEALDVISLNDYQKQPPEVFCKKRCS